MLRSTLGVWRSARHEGRIARRASSVASYAILAVSAGILTRYGLFDAQEAAFYLLLGGMVREYHREHSCPLTVKTTLFLEGRGHFKSSAVWSHFPTFEFSLCL